MINFYRHFLPGVARTLQALTATLAGNPKVLTCLPTMSSDFTAAKVALITAVTLANPPLEAVLSLAMDASDTNVRAVLQQQEGHYWQP
jgi:hypothetical protein